ncbi:ubiquitin-like domain-containing protein CIP73 [Salvia splendens]|uniref:ubiquitin-like domain-containing protein CIP73 n=1 Tax=Salvia splendens TaxID=180675 RepID=UPI001C256F3B|nr:ubiquitin-like domain-containing protein CIP73 [Salvia splendens]XP_042035866.1 ubiquitin-like domain-containing protein CIP73 [Salvia splendens]
MAESKPCDGSSTSVVCGGSSESALQLNVKTLDSRIYSFHVDKNMPVSAFKEKVATQSGVPVGQQRLIFRGKVLKDDHRLSEYNVENEDTLHLVERQPQPSTGSSSGEATSNNGVRGQDSTGGSRHRIGPVAHSIVLGTLNVGDPGEAVVPDLSRVIGAVLNNIGITNLTGGLQPGHPASHGNAAEASQGNAGSENQGGNQSIPWQAFHGPPASHAMQIPLGAAVAIPSLNMPVPDSLSTLVEYMNRMEQALQNGNQPNQSTASGSTPSTVLPPNSRGLPTVEGLSIVLQHAQRLLGEHAVPAISRTAVRLDQERGSNDPTVRGQVQTESIQFGMAMQHLGALFLELGRTVLTLRMGQTPADSFVNTGPAVYISPSGPNPIMVQPFPLQSTSLFGGSSGVTASHVPLGPVGVATVPRNVNIHIHTGAALAPTVSTIGNRAPNGEGMQGQAANATASADYGQAHGATGLNITRTSIQSQPIPFSVSGAVPTGTVDQQTPQSTSISSTVAELSSQIRSLLLNTQGENIAPSGQPDSSSNQEECARSGARDADIRRTGTTAAETSNMDDQKVETSYNKPKFEPSVASDGASHEMSSTSKQGNNSTGGSSNVPIGLGVGGLQPKRRGKQPPAQPKDIDGSHTDSQGKQARAVGQHVLQSLASLSKSGNTNPSPSAQTPNIASGVETSLPAARQNVDGQNDLADAMSQILQGPALDGLLSGVSQQTGVGSPDMLRNMLQQFTQNPTMRNTVNQIAQQMDNQDLGSMFSGLGGGQGGGFDLSRMMQQMMPIVAGALGGISSGSEAAPPAEPVLLENRSRRGMSITNGDPQIDLQQVVQRLTNNGSSRDVFHSLVDGAVNLLGDGSAVEHHVNELGSQEGLVQDFMEMFHHDVSRRIHDDPGS